MLNLGNVPDEFLLHWDYRDMIHKVNLGGGGEVYYNYGSEKQRSRKTIKRLDGTVEERLYLEGMELYRRWKNSVLVEEIETHHLFVDEQRVLIVEDVIETDNTTLKAGVLYRYQYSNHLGSVALELDENAQIITYEEYHPYGTPAYRMKNKGVEASPKRYRYTGMERDEETGLNYHSARYYMPWLGRWVSCDPVGISGGLNLFRYGNNNPIIYFDQDGTDVEQVGKIYTLRRKVGNKTEVYVGKTRKELIDRFAAHRHKRMIRDPKTTVKSRIIYGDVEELVKNEGNISQISTAKERLKARDLAKSRIIGAAETRVAGNVLSEENIVVLNRGEFSYKQAASVANTSNRSL